MKILILSISAGQGHNQTSFAISEYLKSKGEQCIILDAYKYINTLLSDTVEKGYLLSTKYLPEVYGGIYRLLEKDNNTPESTHLNKAANKLFSHKLVRFVNDYEPDVVICTHVFTAQFITYLSKKLVKFKSIGIITDFTVHPFWNETNLDYYVTPSALLNNQMRKNAIPANKILPFGIPIQQKFSFKMDKSDAKKQLGIEDKPTILVMMGSMGFGNIAKTVRKIDTIKNDFQILVVCANNNRAKRIIEHTAFYHKVYTYGYVNNIDVMMDASDLIITKPGGLTVSESLAKNLPMILVNPIPGQEDRNLEFLLNNGIAMHATSTFPIDEAVYAFYNNEFRSKHMSEAVTYFGKPDSAKDLGDFIISLGEQK